MSALDIRKQLLARSKQMPDLEGRTLNEWEIIIDV